MKKTIAVLCLIVSSLTIAYSPRAGASYDSNKAISYLSGHNSSPWALMALAASGISVDTTSLGSFAGSSALDYAVPIMAMAAAGEDPTGAGYVEDLLSFRNNGQLGDAELINDDIFGLLALRSAGLSSANSVVIEEKNYILGLKQPDGGWGYAISANSDSNTTSAAVLALLAAGLEKNDPAVTGALEYLKTAQNNDGGFAYQPSSSWGSSSDASSTAWALWVLNALGLDLNTWEKQGNPRGYLESMQDPSGFFRYQSGALEDSFTPVTTAYAIIALKGEFLPLVSVESPSELNEFRIEGSSSTICAGEKNASNPLDLLQDASAACGYSYEVISGSFGEYVQSVGEDKASGMRGWMYLVNYRAPSVGAADYSLSPEDHVTWYYGEYDWVPLKISLNKQRGEENEIFEASVHQFQAGSWLPAPGATIFSNEAALGNADINGKINLSFGTGAFQIWAEKPDGIRSNREVYISGSGGSSNSSNTVELAADLDQGEVHGAAIGITVGPSKLDFGSVRKGESKTQSVVVQNIGDVPTRISVSVTGHDMFQKYVHVAGNSWAEYEASLPKGGTKNEEINITVPRTYSEPSGHKAGQITFWATGE